MSYGGYGNGNGYGGGGGYGGGRSGGYGGGGRESNGYDTLHFWIPSPILVSAIDLHLQVSEYP